MKKRCVFLVNANVTQHIFRTYRFAVLGMSLSNLLDINQPQDLLRGLINTLSEYDQNKDDNDKPKMVCFNLLHYDQRPSGLAATSKATIQAKNDETTRGRLYGIHRLLIS